jgi:hypothetical protein
VKRQKSDIFAAASRWRKRHRHLYIACAPRAAQKRSVWPWRRGGSAASWRKAAARAAVARIIGGAISSAAATKAAYRKRIVSASIAALSRQNNAQA